MTLKLAIEIAMQGPIGDNQVAVIFRREDAGLGYSVRYGEAVRPRLPLTRGADRRDRLDLVLEDHYADDWEAALVDYTESGMRISNRAGFLSVRSGSTVIFRQVTMELPEGGHEQRRTNNG